MRNFKILSMILIALASSVIFVACSCAPKRNVAPKEIVISQTSSEIYTGKTTTINVNVKPENATDVVVTVSSNNPDIAKVDKSSISGVNGEVVVTGVAEGTTKIEFVIRHTSVTKKVHSITVIKEEKLTAPIIEFNEITNNLEFNAVENAENYELELTNTQTNEVVTKQVEHNETEQGLVLINLLSNNLITPQTKYSVKVRALGHGKKYTTSEYSQALSVLKLQTPQNIRYENGEIVWDKNPIESVKYKYIFNGNSQNPAIAENRIPILKIDKNEKHTIQIMATSNEEGVYDSELSEVFEVYQLLQTTGRFNNLNKFANKTTNSVFEFDEVEGAVSYKVQILNELYEIVLNKTILRSEPLEVEILNDLEDGKNYIIEITSVGNSGNIIDSEPFRFEFTKHHAPTNFKITNGKLEFGHTTNSDTNLKYEIVVVRVSQLSQEQVFETRKHELQLSDVLTDEGSYRIYIRAISSTTPTFANSNQINTNVIYNKLAKPRVNKILNNSVVEFTEIENAVNYHFYINGIRESRINSYELQGNGIAVADISAITKDLQPDIEHTIAVVALNQVQENSSITDAGHEFKFKKLQVPSQNYRISGDTISWDEVAGTNNYNVWENNSPTFSNVLEASYKMQNIQQGNNQIDVMAVGNNQNLISSDINTFKVAGQQLPKPSNIKIENGEFSFEFAEDANYELFIENAENQLEKAVTLTNGNTNIANYLTPNKDVLIGLRAVPKQDIGKLGSAMVKITLHKLAVPVNIEVGRQDNYHDYDLSYFNNVHASNHEITVTHANVFNNFTKVIGANSVRISDDLIDKQSGVYNIRVVAIGDTEKQLLSKETVGYLTSQVSQTYQVVKLNAPQNIVLQDGIITFSAQPNANNISESGFIVKLTDADNVFINEFFTETNSLDITNINDIHNNIKVYVKAVANAIGSVNSDYSEMSDEISTLNKVENVSLENGKIVWDETESLREVLYDVYLQEFESTEIVRVANNLTQTEFEIEQDLSLNNHHKIFVVAKSIGYFNSPLSDEFSVVKLPSVTGFEIRYTPENHELVWELLSNETETEIASGYQVIEVSGNTETVVGVVEAGVNSLAFNNLNVNQPGTHNLKIRAIGGFVDGENYITGNYSETLSVVVLAPVKNLTITGGELSWQHSFESESDKPINYHLSITHQDTDFEREFTLSTDQTSFPFPQKLPDGQNLPEGQYKVAVLSVGEFNKITSAPATRTVIKATANNLNFRSVNGVITWDAYEKPNTVYEIHLASENFEDENSYEFAGSTNQNSFVLPEELLQENVLYQVKLKVVPHQEIASMLSRGLQVVKLPKVQNFAINKGQNNNPHYFSWKQIKLNPELDNYEKAVGGYRIVPQFETSWNEGFVANTETELPFSFPQPGEYKFAIIARGNSALAEQNEIAFLNSDINQIITLAVLDSVKSVVIENGNLVINHSELYSNPETQPQSILVVVKGEILEDEEVAYYKEFNFKFGEGDGQTIWNFKDLETNKLLPSGTYEVTVVAVSEKTNTINSFAKFLPNVVVLSAPSNLNSLNGEFNLQGSETQNFNVYYEFYLNNEPSGLFLLQDIANIKNLITTEPKTLSVRAVAEGAISSDFSEVNITKLPTISGVNIKNTEDNAMLYWNNVQSKDEKFAENVYRVHFNPLTEEMISALSEHHQFNEEGGFLEVVISGEVGLTLPTNLPSGQYNLFIVAVGGERENELKTLYLSSEQSPLQNFYVVGKVENITVNKGIIGWDKATNAQDYRVEIFKGNNIELVSELVASVVVKSLELNLNQFSLTDGNYTAKITALGNQKENITGGEYQTVVFSKGLPLNDFRVADGYLTWTITESIIKHYATSNATATGNLTNNDYRLVVDIILNEAQDINKTLVSNLQPLANPVFAIRKQGQTSFVNHTLSVYSAQVVNGTIVVKYNFNLPEGRYDVKALLQGNRLLSEVQSSGNNLSILNTQQEDENSIQNILHINSLSTTSVPVFKLPAPITPQSGATHSVSNNLLSFNLVSANNETWKNYMIIAQDKSSLTGVVIHNINPNEIEEGAATHSVDVRTISGLRPGITYDLVVVAMGTPNSLNNAGNVNYLTSNFTTQSEVVILAAPLELNTHEGKVSFKTVTGASNYILRIWNDSELYENSEDHDPSVKRVKLQLNIKEVMNNPKHTHHKYLTEKNGAYYYDLENNDEVPNNSSNSDIHRLNRAYYVTVASLGDGIRTINSEENKTNVVKWPKVDLSTTSGIVISDGQFMWNHVVAYHFDKEDEDDAAQERPERYKIIIERYSDNTQIERSEPILIYASQHLTEPAEEDGRWVQKVLYELPDVATFSVQTEGGAPQLIEQTLVATDAFGDPYKYGLVVSAYGEFSASEMLHFATGNTTDSAVGERLRTPQNIKTIEGFVEWGYVSFAGGYKFELAVGDVSIVRDVENHIRYDLSDPIFNAGVFMFSVKAYGSGSSGVLNSLSSEQVKMLKLPTPKLRIEKGEIKWNNEPSNLSQTHTILKIKGPEGFNIYALESMQDIFEINDVGGGVFEVVIENHNLINVIHELSLKEGPAGEYEIQVQYIGSTGLITQENDSFFTTNSNIISIKTTKLEAPVKVGKEGVAGIDVKSADDGGQSYTYVEWTAVANATHYNVVAIKLSEEGKPVRDENGYLTYDKNNIINKVVFSTNDQAHARYFVKDGLEYKFNLQSIIEYDKTQPAAEELWFGDDYYVYVEAFAAKTLAEIGNTVSGYSLSSDSNLEAVLVPLTPENLRILDTGLITWTNRTIGATSVLKISYMENGNPVFMNDVSLYKGESSYQLSLINSNYSVQIKSEINDQSSNYSDVATGSFMLYASGSGSTENPYVVLTADQLYNINHHTNRKFVLGADINLQVSDNPTRAEWRPIGEAQGGITSSEFSGVLDGGGHTVSNILFNNRTARRLGFINTISENGVVKNLTLSITANDIDIELFGGVAVINYGTIDNVVVKGNVYSKQTSTYAGVHYLGGLVAQNYNKIKNSTNELNISSQTNSTNAVHIGGIAYLNIENAIVENSSNKAHLNGVSIGGIVYENRGEVKNVYNIGQITSVVDVNYPRTEVYVGGIIGTNETNATLSHSYVLLEGKVLLESVKSSAKIYAGGLVGANNVGSGRVEHSYAVFVPTINGETQRVLAGGIAGRGVSNNYSKVYFRNNGTMKSVPEDNVPSNINDVVLIREFMTSEGFVNTNYLGTGFKLAPGGEYPLLSWQ